jgi:putative transposase
VVVRYIEAGKYRWGVEPICKVLQFAPSKYYATRLRPLCSGRQRDEGLQQEIARVHRSNCDGVSGAKKVWRQFNREGMNVAHCTVRGVMKEEGLSGPRRGRQFKLTMITDENQHRPGDLVDRQFVASASNRLWVADLTYVKTHSGWVCADFIIDVFSRFIDGWQIPTPLRSDLAIDALDLAICARGHEDLLHLLHHIDNGIQFISWAFSSRIKAAGLTPSIRSIGESYGNRQPVSPMGIARTPGSPASAW